MTSRLITATPVKITLTGPFDSMIRAIRAFKQRPVLHLLTVFFLVLAFVIMTFGMFALRNNNVLLILAMLFTSFVLPMIFAVLTVTKQITELQLNKINYIKYIAAKIWSTNTLQLVFIYILILVALVLGLNLLLMNIESDTLAYTVNAIFKTIFIFLQFISFIAVPANILQGGEAKPFHLLFATFKVILRNFIPCLLFFVISIIIVLVLLESVVILSHLQVLFFYLEIPVLLIFITWFGLACIYLTHKLFAITVN